MLENRHSFLDIETALVSWLAELLEVPAFAEAPSEKPERFVTVERTGGSSSNIVIDRPEVAIQCWGLSRLSAGVLANEVAAAVALMPREIPRITKAVVSSYYRLPVSQEEAIIPRYQIDIALVTR